MYEALTISATDVQGVFYVTTLLPRQKETKGKAIGFVPLEFGDGLILHLNDIVCVCSKLLEKLNFCLFNRYIGELFFVYDQVNSNYVMLFLPRGEKTYVFLL